MDPLTQGLLGAAAAQAAFSHKLPRCAWLVGAVAGMAPDLDVFFHTQAVPLSHLVYHRHFTHALAFIPVGGLIAALPLLWWPVFRGRRGWVVVASIVAYATHGLLDTCTAYGTQLLWPFSDARISWDVISIIDPVFTFTLLVGVVVAGVRARARAAQVALALAVLYLGLGFVQQQRALAVQRQLAAERGHAVERGRAMPTLANLLLWRSVYEADGALHADAVRVATTTTVRRGESLPLLTLDDMLGRVPSDDARGRQAATIFHWFTDGYTAGDKHRPDAVGDMRYSLVTEGFAPMWGVRIDPASPGSAVQWTHLSQRRGDAFDDLWRDITGSGNLATIQPR